MVRQPILVTGVPRSGTTWLARLLTDSPGTALAGREPMNPRGRQYGLGGSLLHPDVSQRRRLRSAYAGVNPWLFSRYGRRQWAAVLPWTRVIVKDPFAMLSMPAVCRATGARPILLYRHPAAVLTSYRRMRWLPDVEELAPVVEQYNGTVTEDGRAPVAPEGAVGSDVEAMGWFWSVLYTMALTDVAQLPDALVVSHEELASGGARARHRLFTELGLSSGDEGDDEPETDAVAGEAADEGAEGGDHQGEGLHDFDRAPAQVATAWRTKLTPDEIATIEARTADVRDRLLSARLTLRVGA
jgi:Sulfotransferase family